MWSTCHMNLVLSVAFLVAVLRGTIMSPQPGFTFCDLTMISTAKKVIIPPIALKPNF